MVTEQQILDHIRKATPNSKKYLHDDAAVIENNLVITTDSLVENTHFTLSTYTPEDIGYKALAVNLSDIASMGAIPKYALVALSFPKSINLSWIKGLHKGIIECAKKYKTQLIGGNLARAKEINITITVIGKILKGKIGKRSNAKAGDLVFSTGSFGDSACRLLLRKKERIVPQIELGQKIVSLSKKAPALMDSSDGLADCLIQIADESKVKITVEEDKIPMSIYAKKTAITLNRNPITLALYGGEDYQLVGTASKNDCKKLKKLKGIKIIGQVLKGNGAFLKQKDGRVDKLNMNMTFKHFK